MKQIIIINRKLTEKESNIMINLTIAKIIFTEPSLEDKDLKLMALKKVSKDSKNKK